MRTTMVRGMGGWAVAVAVMCASAQQARAAFHLWDIKEVYSNADGTIQFIELFSASAGQNLLLNHTIRAGGGTFTFPSNSPTPTTNRHLLLATAGFASLPGAVTPNYIIPNNFINRPTDTINFAEGSNIVSFNNLPTDGLMSLTWNPPGGATRSVTVNSPTNHAGQVGSINLTPMPEPGDVNGDDVVDDLDIDALHAAIFLGENDDVFDLNGDGMVNAQDVTMLVQDHLGTRRGDLDLNKMVNITDLSRMAANFGQSFTPPGGGAGAGGVETNWSRGDVNGDFIVNITDLSLLATNFGFDGTGGGAGGAVPEPATAGLLLLGTAMLRRRRTA